MFGILLLILGLSSFKVRGLDDRFIDDGSLDRRPFCNCNNVNCFCVQSYQCERGVIKTDGANILDARKSSPSSQGGNLDSRNSLCSRPRICCRLPGTGGNPGGNPSKHQCGVSRPEGVDRRIMSGGQNSDTTRGEFPWQGAILMNSNGKSVFKCSCVLIGSSWALTIAHCVSQYRLRRPIPIFARFGVWDTRVTYGYKDANISQIIVHPGFQNSTLKNDIALLRFTRPLPYTPQMAQICLPFLNENHFGENCLVTGWGKSAWYGGSYSTVLRKVSVRIRRPAECERMLRNTRLGQYYNFDRSFMCAGGEKEQDACKGDGGGPLSCYRRDGTYSVMGLVSWGINCGQPGVPGVYTNVSYFLNWILRTTGEPASAYWPLN